jgi:hypothetical protein
MSRLLSLYPRAWRDRYEAEVGDLIAARPMSFRDRFDLVRGAVDAWLHPQVMVGSGSAHDDEARDLVSTVPAVIGGLLWIAGGVIVAAAPYGADGYKVADLGILAFALAAFVSGAAALSIAQTLRVGSRGATASAVVMLASALLLLTPWPVLVIGFYGYVFSTIAFGALIARETMVGAGASLVGAALILLGLNLQNSQSLLAVPFGLAWIAVGVVRMRRLPVATGT